MFFSFKKKPGNRYLWNVCIIEANFWQKMIAIVVSRVLKIWWNIYDQSRAILMCWLLAPACLPGASKIIRHRGAVVYFILLTNTGPSRVHDTARHHNAWLCGPKSNVTQLSLDFCKKLPLGSSPGRLRAINFDCNRFSNVCNTWNKKYKYGANSLSNCRGTRKPCEVRVHWTGLYWWTCCVVCCDVMCDDPTVWRWWCNGRVASS